MPLVPARTLVLLLIVPLALGALTVADRTLLVPMLAADGGIFLIAAIDALLAYKPRIVVSRESPDVLSIGRQNRVDLFVRSNASRKLRVRVTNDLFPEAYTDGLPLELEVPERRTVRSHYLLEPRRRGAYLLGDLYARYPSPLGLWMRQLRFAASSPVRVYPDLKRIRTFDLLARHNREYAFLRATRLKGGESEFERLREYARDDE